MSEIFRLPCLACAVLLIGSSAAFAEILTIDFESYPGPDGVLGTGDDVPAPSCDLICNNLGDEYESLGIVFSSGLLFQSAFFPRSTPENHYVSSSPIDATFSRAVHSISIDSYSVWNAVLYALDEFDNVLATDLLTNPNVGSFFFGTLKVTSEQPIRRFTVLAEGCAVGGPCDEILNVDDLTISDTRCLPDETTLCLNGDRFQVEVEWRDFGGNTGPGRVVPFSSDDSGLFWFFSPDNWELMVKVLDGCGINDRVWVFAAATTDVQYTLRVTDTETDEISEYFNPLGIASAAVTDTGAFAACP